ncbi:MAG: hypothetical protein WBM04_01030 [Candidatus Korobacteraceae bacterium]
MTCREFERRTEALTLREVSQVQDQQIVGHAGECQKCAVWLQQQRTLAVTMQTLQARTASFVAGPETERVLLQAFRQRPALNGPPEMAEGFTPIAMRLSRFFEIGAYVAVAAAILVGLFLGVQLLEKRGSNSPVASQSLKRSASIPGEVPEKSVVTAEKSESNLHRPAVLRSDVARLRTRHAVPISQSDTDTAETSETSADAGYVALMFCDPLSCSSDTQVVRMELPNPGVSSSSNQQDAQVRIADVVVGYDGVVRAVRIVN